MKNDPPNPADDLGVGYPEVSTFTTAGYMYQKRRTTPPEYQDYMDWYCPLTSVYDPELSARLRQQGKQVWWYVCCGPQHPYANFAALDYPSIEGRLLGWMTCGFQADGLLFWHVNRASKGRPSSEPARGRAAVRCAGRPSLARP